MQAPKSNKPTRKTQAERRQETTNALLSAARELFVEQGFANTGTPEIVTAAGVTRGALYHHFADKTDLFRAVAAQEAHAIATHIDAATRNIQDPQHAMIAGTNAYFDAMSVPGRAKLLLSDATAILGFAEAVALTKPQGSEELKDGLKRAIPDLSAPDLDALTHVLSAAFDRAALEIADGAERGPYVKALLTLIGKAMA